MTLTRMADNTPFVIQFEGDTEFNIDTGSGGATILALYRRGSQQIVHVRETRDQIIHARLAALSGDWSS
ncbi:hypothetical protein [Paracoccus sp. Ld10]|uniref:hypothetical protein n=1 Tax=Paracoccus sp. Ld10 TaxID=649158 RepID=UPI00386DBDCE